MKYTVCDMYPLVTSSLLPPRCLFLCSSPVKVSSSRLEFTCVLHVLLFLYSTSFLCIHHIVRFFKRLFLDFFPTSNKRPREKAVRRTGNYTRQSDCPLLNLVDRLIMRSLESIRPKTENDRPGELCRCVVVFHFTLRNHRCDNRMEWSREEEERVIIILISSVSCACILYRICDTQTIFSITHVDEEGKYTFGLQ